MKKYTETEIKELLQNLSGWELKKDAIHKEFVFADFVQAFAFMTKVAMIAEKMDHHPDWTNGYNKVSISLSTHSAKAITNHDIELATAIDKLS